MPATQTGQMIGGFLPARGYRGRRPASGGEKRYCANNCVLWSLRVGVQKRFGGNVPSHLLDSATKV